MSGRTNFPSTNAYTPIQSWQQGVKAGIPIIIGYLPMAVSYGVLAVQTGIPLFHTVAMSMLVFAGASQFMAVNMIALGVGAAELIIATFVLNFRHFVMNMSLMNVLKRVPQKYQAVLSFGITDETFAVSSMEGEKRPEALNVYFMLGLLMAAYWTWVLGSLLGGLLSMVIPPSIGASMSIALYAMFIGLLVPAVHDSWRVGLIAGISAGLCSLFYLFLSDGWAIVLATLLGSLVGVGLKERDGEREKEHQVKQDHESHS